MFPIGLHYVHLIHGPNRVSGTIVSRFSQTRPQDGDRSGCTGFEFPPGCLLPSSPATEGSAPHQLKHEFSEPVA